MKGLETNSVHKGRRSEMPAPGKRGREAPPTRRGNRAVRNPLENGLEQRPHPLGHGLVGEHAKLHLCLQPLPVLCITTWAPPPVRSVASFDSPGAWTLLWTAHGRDLGCMLPSPHSRCGKKPHPPDVGSWKNCLPWNWSLMLKKTGTAGLQDNSAIPFKV